MTEPRPYLTAILNSEVTRKKAEHWQSQGQWGARDFDKVMFNLPIPKFDRRIVLHKELAAAAARAEKAAAAVTLRNEIYFVRARSAVRQALVDEGIAQAIDKLVEKLLK